MEWFISHLLVSLIAALVLFGLLNLNGNYIDNILAIGLGLLVYWITAILLRIHVR